jgi:hypothetical protein
MSRPPADSDTVKSNSLFGPGADLGLEVNAWSRGSSATATCAAIRQSRAFNVDTNPDGVFDRVAVSIMVVRGSSVSRQAGHEVGMGDASGEL